MTSAPSESGLPTVAVQLTARGVGAIGVVLLTGKNAAGIIQAISRSPKVASLRPGQFMRSALVATGSPATKPSVPEGSGPAAETSRDFDDALVVRVSEDAYELHVHGGVAVMSAALEALRCGGAIIVSPVEAVDVGVFGTAIDGELSLALSQATTMTGLRLLAQQKSGGIVRWANQWREVLQNSGNAADLWPFRSATQWVLTRSRLLARLIEPARVAIVGAPNVGKSTLANALLGRPVSITSDQAGTTRDWVDARAIFTAGDVAAPVILIDTAGIRETQDSIEQESIVRTHQQAALADVVVVVFDATRDSSAEEVQLARSFPARPVVIAVNKTDAVQELPQSLALLASAVVISAKVHTGIDQLMTAVLGQLDLMAVDIDEPFAFTERQRQLLQAAAIAEQPAACIDLLEQLASRPR